MEFEDLEAWKEARELVRRVYSIRGGLDKDFGLRDQIRRAAVSTMANIAEGFERWNAGEKRQFYNIARASCGEVRSLLYVLLDTKYLSSEDVQALRNLSIRTGKLVTGLMKSLDAKK